MNRPPIIGVVGGGACSPEVAEQAAAVGRGIAERGGVVICGGLGGVMEACCRGAREAGGQTIGLLPGRDPAEANPYVTTPIATGAGFGRNVMIVHTAQAVIAIDGKHGTLSEIAFCLQLGVPVIGLGTWEVDPAIEQVETPTAAVARAFERAAQAR